MYLLGYLPKENRVYLMDKSHNVYSYSLLVSVLVYQTAIVRRDFEAAAKALAGIPADHHNRIARFLEAQDLKELALEVSNDPEHKFELAMQTKKLTVNHSTTVAYYPSDSSLFNVVVFVQLARDILLEAESEQKWKQLGDAALNQEFDLKLAEECFGRSKDLGGLLLLYTSLGDADGLNRLAKMASEQGRHNIAFVCLLLLHRLEDCVNLLCTTERIPEAAFMTRTYLPSHISRVLALWKENLKQVYRLLTDTIRNNSLFYHMTAMMTKTLRDLSDSSPFAMLT
jgi:coatomer subunit beta'